MIIDILQIVKEIIREIGTDLNQDRSGERRRERENMKDACLECHCATDDDRHNTRPQRLWAGCKQPDLQSAHVWLSVHI
jgi:hypothetical protein